MKGHCHGFTRVTRTSIPRNESLNLSQGRAGGRPRRKCERINQKPGVGLQRGVRRQIISLIGRNNRADTPEKTINIEQDAYNADDKTSDDRPRLPGNDETNNTSNAAETTGEE